MEDLQKALTTKQINDLIEHCPSSRLEELIQEYIHNSRNQEIVRKKLLTDIPYEPLSAEYDLTPRQCFNIVKKAKRTIVLYLDP